MIAWLLALCHNVLLIRERRLLTQSQPPTRSFPHGKLPNASVMRLAPACSQGTSPADRGSDLTLHTQSPSAADLFNGQLPDASLLGWAAACASSRAFRLGGASASPSMLPGIDLCNHSLEPSCGVSVRAADGAATLVAKRDLRAGKKLVT